MWMGDVFRVVVFADFNSSLLSNSSRSRERLLLYAASTKCLG